MHNETSRRIGGRNEAGALCEHMMVKKFSKLFKEKLNFKIVIRKCSTKNILKKINFLGRKEIIPDGRLEKQEEIKVRKNKYMGKPKYLLCMSIMTMRRRV